MQTVAIEVGGYSMPVVISPASKKNIAILSPGFSSNPFDPSYIFTPLTKRLNGIGISVARYAYRGSDLCYGPYSKRTDGGKTKEIIPFFMSLLSREEDLASVMGYCRERGYESIFLIGSSLGGTTVLQTYAKDQDKDISALVLMCTPFNLRDTAAYEQLKIENKRLTGKGPFLLFGKKISRELMREICKTNVYDLLRQVSCPILFVHGSEDKIVDESQTIQAYYNTPIGEKRIHSVGGAGHNLKGGEERAVSNIEFFLEENGLV